LIDETSDRPRTKQVADLLRQAIERGELEPRSRLPSPAELGRTYGMHRNSGRAVLAILVAEGLVIPVRHIGHIVAEPEPERIEHPSAPCRVRAVVPSQPEVQAMGYRPGAALLEVAELDEETGE
jgi:DNA-binding FadR family transcriptional regulator